MPLGQRRDRHRRPVGVPQFGGEIALQVGGHPRRVVVHLGPDKAPSGEWESRRAASWRRDVTPSFANALRRWYSTVLTLTTSSAASSRLERPAAARRATTSSCAVSRVSSRPRRGLGRSPDAASSRAQRSAYGVGAELGEALLRGGQQLGGPPPLPRPAQELPRRQPGARRVERERHALHRVQRARERRLGLLGAPQRGLDPAARPREPGDRRLPARWRRRAPRAGRAARRPPRPARRRRAPPRTGPATPRSRARPPRRGTGSGAPVRGRRAPPRDRRWPRRSGPATWRRPRPSARSRPRPRARPPSPARPPTQSPRAAGTSAAMPTTIDRVKSRSASMLIATARSACTTASSQAPARYSALARNANENAAVFSTPSSEAASAAAAEVGACAVEVVLHQPQRAAGRAGLQPVVVRAVRGGDGGERLGGAARVAEAVGEVGAGRPVGDRVRAGVLQRPPAPRDRARAVEAAVAVHRVLEGDRGPQLGIGVLAAGRPRPAQEGLRFGGAPGGHGERAEHAVALGPRREVGDLAAVRRRARRVAVLEHPGDGLEHAPLPVGRVRALPGGFDEARRGRGPRLALRLAARERLQVGGERGVGNRRRGDPVPQHRRGLGDQRRRRGVQRAAPGHAERVVHRRPDERVREGHRDRGARAGLRDEARSRGLVQRRQRLLQPRQRRHLRERAVHAEHGGGVDEVARGRGAAGPAVLDDQRGTNAARAAAAPPCPTTAPGTRRAAPWRAAGCPGAVAQATGAPPATTAIRAGPRGRAARARRARAARWRRPPARRRPGAGPPAAR